MVIELSGVQFGLKSEVTTSDFKMDVINLNNSS